MTPTARKRRRTRVRRGGGGFRASERPALLADRRTFGGRGERGGGGLGVAEEHLLVEAPQGVVGGVGVLLDEDVAGRHDVDHDHLHRHAAGEEQLRRGGTGEDAQQQGGGPPRTRPNRTVRPALPRRSWVARGAPAGEEGGRTGWSGPGP